MAKVYRLILFFYALIISSSLSFCSGYQSGKKSIINKQARAENKVLKEDGKNLAKAVKNIQLENKEISKKHENKKNNTFKERRKNKDFDDFMSQSLPAPLLPGAGLLGNSKNTSSP